MKIRLMLISVLPMPILFIIRNIDNMIKAIALQNGGRIISFIAIGVFTLSIIIIVFSIKSIKKESQRGFLIGNTVTSIENQNSESLAFFISYLLPIITISVDGIGSLATSVVIIIIFCLLICKTSLVYSNPVLTILGFNLYSMHGPSFIDNKAVYILSTDVIEMGSSIIYKRINDNAYFAIKKEGKV